jgi:hypothetical protein
LTDKGSAGRKRDLKDAPNATPRLVIRIHDYQPAQLSLLPVFKSNSEERLRMQVCRDEREPDYRNRVGSSNAVSSLAPDFTKDVVTIDSLVPAGRNDCEVRRTTLLMKSLL